MLILNKRKLCNKIKLCDYIKRVQILNIYINKLFCSVKILDRKLEAKCYKNYMSRNGIKNNEYDSLKSQNV